MVGVGSEPRKDGVGGRLVCAFSLIVTAAACSQRVAADPPPSLDELAVCGDLQEFHADGDVVIPYPGTAGAVASTSFSLAVDGKAVFVESFDAVSYAHFAFSGTAHVTLSSIGGAKALAGYSLRPASFGIKTTTDQGTVTFDLAVPRKFVFWNGTPTDMLIVLADSVEDQSYRPSDRGVTDIASYGVTASGAATETTLIQKALDDIGSGAGGVLYFGPGTYLTGTLRIGSQTTVYLAPGATLRGTGAKADYPRDPELNDGVAGKEEAVPEVVQLEFDSAVDSRLLGRGVVDMNGTALRAAGAKGGRLMMVKNSQNIEVKDVILRDSASWNTQILYSTNVTFSNVKVLNHIGKPWNLDGIDPDSAQSVLVDDAFILSGDDGFAVKSTGAFLKLVRDSTDIVVRNSTVYSGTSALKIGSESLAEHTERVTYENVDVVAAICPVRLIVRDGSAFRDNAWRSIRVERLLSPPLTPEIFQLPSLFQLLVQRRYATSVVGTMDSTTLEDIEAPGPGPNPSMVWGYDSTHEVTETSFVDLLIAGQHVLDVGGADLSLNEYADAPTFSTARKPTVFVEAATPYAKAGCPGTFVIGRLPPSAADLGFDFNATDLEVDFNVYGSALTGSDYESLPTQVVIPKGAVQTTLSVIPTGAAKADVKTVRLSLASSPDQSYLLGPKYQAVVTLTPLARPIDDGPRRKESTRAP